MFDMLRKAYEREKITRENLEKLQTEPPNVNKMVDCCHSCKERYIDDSDMALHRVFCTKHKRWMPYMSKCSEFQRIKEGWENGEGEPHVHVVIQELNDKDAW